MEHHESPLSNRCSGVLLHPSSLPGGVGLGDLGPSAYLFIDFLKESGFSVWQMLPMVPTHGDLSPYQGLSVHAGNPLLISLHQLQAWGWLEGELETQVDDFVAYRMAKLREAYDCFRRVAGDEELAEFGAFVGEHNHWLQDYALFQAIRKSQGNQHWMNWPAELRGREPTALAGVEQTLADDIAYVRFEQFVFFRQWKYLSCYARKQGILMFGDMPIFVAHDSAEVWAKPENFMLDDDGHAQVVAGVPPDYFSETGQLWGNPHYQWDAMQADGFQWWKQRIESQLHMFDWVRIDHFRGFEAYWEVPAGEETAINGHWVKAPGDALFHALHEQFDPLPLVAEDLGVITPEVDALRKKYHMPGMKILQFAFGGDASNPYLPHNQTYDSVVYTGTHDNDTTLGWYLALPEHTKDQLSQYYGECGEEMPWPLIRSALSSVACLAILPMQDLLELDGTNRMNVPGTSDGNWRWRFKWQQVGDGLAEKLADMNRLYGR